jgi:hypothetical protein
MKAMTIGSTALLLVLSACSGGGGSPESATTLGTSPTLMKLTASEYASAVNDLLSIAPSAQPVPVASAGGSATASASSDEAALGYHDAAFAIASMATSSNRLGGLLQRASCTAPASDSGAAGAACAAAFIQEFAPQAFRGAPIDAPTLAGLNEVYTSVAVAQGAGFSGGIAAVLQEILQSPYFLYKGWPA